MNETTLQQISKDIAGVELIHAKLQQMHEAFRILAEMCGNTKRQYKVLQNHLEGIYNFLEKAKEDKLLGMVIKPGFFDAQMDRLQKLSASFKHFGENFSMVSLSIILDKLFLRRQTIVENYKGVKTTLDTDYAEYNQMLENYYHSCDGYWADLGRIRENMQHPDVFFEIVDMARMVNNIYWGKDRIQRLEKTIIERLNLINSKVGFT